MQRLVVPAIATIFALSIACVRVERPAVQPTPAIRGASLWVQPNDLRSRDVFHGPWGAANAPQPAAVYTLVERKHTGVNPGMTVVDAEGREWSVKQTPPGGLDSEGQVEVAVSRLLSAIGYHQPPVYYLPAFTLEDDWGRRTEIGGRFRLKEKTLKDLGEWSWQHNPFIGSPSFEGLLALMMMLNATDLKNSNNTLYEHRRGDFVEHWYVARDVGASLGDGNRFAPRKGDPRAFARQPFLLGVSNGYVDFAYDGWYRNLVRDRIKPDHVRWVSSLLAQLTDRQWRDIFRAGGYSSEESELFIRALKAKIEQGRSIGRRAAN